MIVLNNAGFETANLGKNMKSKGNFHIHMEYIQLTPILNHRINTCPMRHSRQRLRLQY